MNKFKCESCGKTYEKDDEYTKWNYWCRCECGEKAKWDSQPARVVMTKFIKGYNYGYNEGLGVEIKSEKHYKDVCKERGVKPM